VTSSQRCHESFIEYYVVCCDLREAVTMIIACMQNTAGFRYQTVIHHCTLCDHPINDGSERLFTGSYDSPQGECRCFAAPLYSDYTRMCHSHMRCGLHLRNGSKVFAIHG